ncbi:MAG: excinuclease ABC subunit UvrC [Patescibacteria group bacterium]|nr:excinuclease ABC subunit UvrC [Patescibacteria group bacterium]
MAIPENVKLKKDELPPRPGVYFMKDAAGKIMYVGKATSLRTRVSSYFTRPADARIAQMVKKIREIDWEETPTAVEALILEAKNIKKLQPPYNVRDKDDKSRVYLAFTREDYPRPVLIREHELVRTSKKRFLKTFGPFKSTGAVQASLDALRKAFPWSTCKPNRGRPCFYVHLGQCAGVCTGNISSRDYKVIIRGLMRYFDGKRGEVVRSLKRNMKAAAERKDFEVAASYRDRLWALEHIRDMAIMKRDDAELQQFIDVFGRVEGYDISNISGQDAVGSMVVFEDGRPKKSAYRKFRIKTVVGSNDTAMLEEMLRRRFARVKGQKGQKREKGQESERARKRESWRLPDLILIDGGRGQLNVAKRVLEDNGLNIPLVGIAKGFDRKQDELVYDKKDNELARLTYAFKPLLQHVRDEAHRFAISYHRKRRMLRRTRGSSHKPNRS